MGTLAAYLPVFNLLFVAQRMPYAAFASQSAGVAANHDEGPAWWGMIDVALFVVSLFAVVWSARKSSKQWMKYALYTTWIAPAFLIFNEKLEGIRLPEEMIYIPAIRLTLLHLYNKKYCQCADDQCCTAPEK
ncbi:MerC family mercury resistance protein [Dyadobacter sp. 32]|uniref:MerC family mercury resistance protein n=1 Tax=Dyadobacter sp. 32 TaxID=538966 RepID=UPI0011EC5E41